MSNLLNKTLLTICLTLCCAVCHAQEQPDSTIHHPDHYGETTIKAWLDTTSMTIGDQQVLHIHIAKALGGEIAIPKEEEMTTPFMEALETESDTTDEDIELRVTFTSFETGHHRVPNIVLTLVSSNGNIMLSPSDSLFFDVVYTADADTTKCEVFGDVENIHESYTFWEIVRWVVYAVLAAALVAALIWVLKRRKEHKPIVVLPKPKPVPADKRAIAELEALRRKELWQKGRIKRYYTDLTDIVRRFLRNMYGINASEMTTRQTLRAFHGISDWSEESERCLQQLLQKADMVKFAKSQPEAHEHDQAMQFAVDFVRIVADIHRANNPEEGLKDKKDKE